MSLISSSLISVKFLVFGYEEYNQLMEQKDPRILFGRCLVAFRHERGWSQEKLALESGLARSYLSEVERGIRNISLLNICRLADTLALDPSELLKIRSD